MDTAHLIKGEAIMAYNCFETKVRLDMIAKRFLGKPRLLYIFKHTAFPSISLLDILVCRIGIWTTSHFLVFSMYCFAFQIRDKDVALIIRI